MKFAVAGAVIVAAMASTGAQAATANADARVEIITPVTITKTSDLDFGLVATNGAGTVVVAQSGGAKSRRYRDEKMGPHRLPGVQCGVESALRAADYRVG